MTSKLLALFLALWVGLPICCCDVLATHFAKPVQDTEAEHGCCHAEWGTWDQPSAETSTPCHSSTREEGDGDCLCQIKGMNSPAGEQKWLPAVQHDGIPQPVEYVPTLSEGLSSLLAKPPVDPPRFERVGQMISQNTGRQFCEYHCQWQL